MCSFTQSELTAELKKLVGRKLFFRKKSPQSYFMFRITSKGHTIRIDAMEVILIDQNRSDSFLLKFFLDEMDFISDLHEFDDYGKVLTYLNEKNQSQYKGQLTILCTEDIRKKRGADFLAFVSEEYSNLNMYRILMGEDNQSAQLLLQARRVDDYLEKKIELDDFGIETNRVMMKARRKAQVPRIASFIAPMNRPLPAETSDKPSVSEPVFQIKSIIPTCVFRLFAHK